MYFSFGFGFGFGISDPDSSNFLYFKASSYVSPGQPLEMANTPLVAFINHSMIK